MMFCKIYYMTVLNFLLIGLVSSTTLAQDQNLYHFADPVPIELNLNRIAIFAGNQVQSAAESLQDLGVTITNVESSPIPGWQLLDIEFDDVNESLLEDTINRLSEKEKFNFVSPVFFDDLGGPLIPTRDILVRFNPGIGEERQDQILAEANIGTVLDRNWANMPGAYRIRSHSNNGFVVLEQANALASLPDVRFAEPDMIFTGRNESLLPNDTFFSSAWGLHNTGQNGSCQRVVGTPDMDMDAPEAWDITTGDPNIMVLIMDNGVQQDHPDLNQIPGEDFTGQGGGGGPFNACDNHGTAVAGGVSAIINNNLGIVGVAPDCRAVSARIFISNVPCDGLWTTQFSWGVDALAWAENLGVRVTNNSNQYGAFSSALADKYNQTRNNGMIHFASAGNSSSSNIDFPAELTSVNAIAALNANGQLASFSNYGQGLAFSAPGKDITTLDRTGSAGFVNGDYACINGTSFASPYAAGVAALILSVDSSLNAFDVEQVMQESSVDLGAAGYDTIFGWGFVNAHQAIADDLPICEPNEICSNACDIGVLTEQYVHSELDINPSGDEDYFKFTTIGNGGPDDFIRIDFIHALGDLNLCLWNSNCELIECYTSQTDNEQFSLEGLPAGTYIVQVNSSLGHTNDYTLIIDPPLGNFEEDFKLLPNDIVSGEWFGFKVATSGSTAIVGAFRDSDNGIESGSAYLFNVNTGEQIFKLLPNDGEPFDWFGFSVGISGNTAIVGNRGDDDNGNNSGSAYLFDITTGQQIAKLVPNDAAENDRFGISVGISGSIAIVGAFFDDDNGSNSGSAYLFDITTGNQIAKLLPIDGEIEDRFGISVGISGNTAIVGSWFDDDNGDSSGSAYLFDTLSGQQIFKLLPQDGAANDEFGFSVEISGSTAIVGASFNDDVVPNAGSAYLFDTTTGQQIAKLLPNDVTEDGQFGHSVGISGSTAIVGAWFNDEIGESSGSTYLFDSTSGAQTAKLLPSDGAANDLFGNSVAISGPAGEEVAIVGAFGGDDNGESSGSAYIFSLAISSPCPADLDGNGSVGTGDLLALFVQWGTDGPADFDGNGTVGTGDLLILFANWGPCE